MAEAANRSPFRLPRGVKKATLKPGKAGSGKQAKPMQFAPSDEHAEAEKDFDQYLQEAMTKKDAPSSQLSKEETESAAVMAQRLADRYAEDGEGITGRDLAMLAKAGAAVTAPAEDDDDLAEPLDMQKLIQAREKMADLPPARPENAGPIDELPTKPELKPMPQEKASAEETLQPLPEDEKPQKIKLSPMPSEDELLEALKGFPKGDDEGDAFAKKLAELAVEDDLPTEEFGDDEPGGVGGGPRLSFAADPRLPGAEPEPKFRGLAEKLTPVGIWLSFATMVGAVGYAASRGGVDLLTASLFGAGILIFVTVLTLGAMMQAYSPILLTSFLFKRPGRKKDEALALAGGDLLGALGLAEGIIDADADARLVTTRDGVVVYANDAYLQIAEEAGIVGATGLPPRIDRLFGQSGTESSKMFRLAKACRSGLAAEEVLTQTMGRSVHEAQGDLPVRRFTVQTRPMRPTEDGHIYSAWRLQEQEVDRKQDSLKAAFFTYPRPVIAVERSGSIAWINTAAAELFGTKPGQPLSLGDLVLGESNPVVRHLWEPEAEEYEARIRQRGAAANQSKDVVLTPFTRGGPGEGFICVEVADKAAAKADPEGVTAGADLTDAPFGIAVLEGDPSADGKVTYANELFRGFFPQADEGAKFTSVLSSEAVSELMAALKSRPNTKPLTKPIEVRVGEGAQAHTFRLFARPVRRRRGAYGPRQTVLYAVDITYQRRMEEETIQGQKLQQIGQIAGSVAHDFNNLLLVVKGSTELLMRNHPVGDPSYRDLAMIYETSQRAQDLTRNLLAFSRKQTLTPEICSITELLNDFTPALKRCVSEKVQLNVVHGRNLPEVKCDKGQVDLAIMNLAVNARDAMTASKGSGTLTIETRQVPAEEISEYGYEVLEEVDHVLIEVADTGGGVPEEHVEKIFEPFFTTKGEGQGTGLGLSTVAGAIGQMGGRIFLFNRKGDGATFRIFLPAVTAEEAAVAKERRQNVKKAEEAKDVTGKGRILVVEDEDGVRSIVVRALGMCGYEIHEATDGEEALEMIEEDEGSFDLVLTDIMMPEMDGPTLIQEAGDKLKGAKVVFMSGYAEAAMREKLNEIDGAKYLQKPFTLNSVAAVVKEALAR
ncbi:response regulator [Parvularcula sp. ZS-1/3]|uniref:histidine kinase n=1 Tax=Parvularcula mediterranea TaxID=2732508 RepID=A0A7Y3RQ35_9PROT|nr:response regulator [Parvularcula mediterranea]NNU17651.1 response regulator [Parvularcula mediterranea]